MFLTLLPYLTAAANLLLVLVILLGLSQRIRGLRMRAANQEKIAQVESASLSSEIGLLKKRVQDLEDSGTPGAQPAPATPENSLNQTSVNHTLRSKVLKMHRLGQPPERIAGNLRVNRGEVDLMVKVHEIVMRPYEEPAPSGAAQKV
jgi:hypothetical protein